MNKLTSEQRDWWIAYFRERFDWREDEKSHEMIHLPDIEHTLNANTAEDAQLNVGKEEWLDIVSSGPTYVKEEITSPLATLNESQAIIWATGRGADTLYVFKGQWIIRMDEDG